MTIRPGADWGVDVARPAAAIVAHTDADVVAAGPGRDIVLAGGDLHRSLGAPGARDPVRRVHIDGLAVRPDDGEVEWCIAHVVMRRSWWRGTVVAVMNVDHMGHLYVAPRAHPNDGQFDVVTADRSLRLRDRLAARRRLPSGSHVPHPSITTSRGVTQRWTFDRPHKVFLDGRSIGRVRSIDVTIEPDRYVVHF